MHVNYILAILPTAVHAAITGVNYDPAHCSFHPKHGGSRANLPEIMHRDFKQMRQYFSTIKTYYSSYYQHDVMPIAASYGFQVYLGVYMTRESWGEEQVNAAIRAALNYRSHVNAIVVGNENVREGDFQGSFSADEIIQLIHRIRQATHYRVPITTSQRINEWLSNSDDIRRLAEACDFIGVTIYPFFSHGFQSHDPIRLLDLQWNQMIGKYPNKQVTLVETGYPTKGTAPPGLPWNLPSRETAERYYNAVMDWHRGDRILFKFYDRRTTLPLYERYFGLCTADRALKFPLRRVNH